MRLLDLCPKRDSMPPLLWCLQGQQWWNSPNSNPIPDDALQWRTTIFVMSQQLWSIEFLGCLDVTTESRPVQYSYSNAENTIFLDYQYEWFPLSKLNANKMHALFCVCIFDNMLVFIVVHRVGVGVGGGIGGWNTVRMIIHNEYISKQFSKVTWLIFHTNWPF